MTFLSVLRSDFNVLSRCLNRYVTVKNNLKTLSIRTLTDDSKLFVPKKIAGEKLSYQLQRSDKIPDEYTLIYRVKKTISFSLAHAGVLVISLIIPFTSFVLAKRHEFKFPIILNDQMTINGPLEVCFLVIFSSFIVLSAMALVNRFPFRIYLNRSTNDFIAVFSNPLLPWKTSQVKFKEGEVSIIPEDEQFFFQLSNYKIKGNKVIFLEDKFEKPIDLEIMVGLHSSFKKKN